MNNVAIVGGGPGGLITAYLLEQRLKDACRITIFEAAGRVGGKILTARFDSVPVIYEAGVAECYDYSLIGNDGLRQLVSDLCLNTVLTNGSTVVMDGKLVRDKSEIGKQFGQTTQQAIDDFERLAAAMLPIDNWKENSQEFDNNHPWAARTCEELLNEVHDPAARKYLKVSAHSDLATEPHLTNGLNGLKNLLMNVPGYIGQYSIHGGMEMIVHRLQEKLSATRLELNSRVVGLKKDQNDRYCIRFQTGYRTAQREFDAVVAALPVNWLSSIEWEGDRLRKAMASHVAYYDRPGHYLRISILFEEPFWRNWIQGSWFMLDAFGGCCVYDESSRHDTGDYGVMGWLLSGTDALLLGNLDDGTLIQRAIDSLPDGLAEKAKQFFIEGKVHRWAAAVSAQPGGLPVRDARSVHTVEPIEHPGLFIVGDYLFDSTLNGVFESASLAVDMLCEWTQSVPYGALSRAQV